MRTVRTFVRREGRSSPGQRLALDQLAAEYLLNYPLEGQWETWFGRSGAKRVLEIGFGMGDALLADAAKAPGMDFLGIEVHTPGIGRVLLALKNQGFSNIRLCAQDSLEVLTQLPIDCFDISRIFFPDPWPKKKHHKRRLIQSVHLPLLLSRLKPGGILHLATDWQEYAEQMLTVLTASDALINLGDHSGFSDRAGRPITKFERRGLKLGHVIRDLRFIKKTYRNDEKTSITLY